MNCYISINNIYLFIIYNSINKYDNSLRKSLEEICQSSFDEDSWCQATLPIREGGLGIISECNIAPAAYLSSVSQAIPFISNLSISLDIDGILKDSISKIISLGYLNDKEILDERIGLQKKLCTPIYLKSKGNLLNRSTTRNKARLLSLSVDHAGAWLLAVPNPSMGLSFCILLGLPLYSISRTCPACNKTLLDIYGDHSLICGAGSERTNKHNYVRDTLYYIMNSAGLSLSLETAI